MGLFDIFKQRKDVWRNKDGRIECPGDDCPKTCDETCPIWCQTLAIQKMQSGQHEAAIAFFKKALSIAPDFKDAWVNLASTYGMMNNDLEANKAFKAAYALDDHYRQAIHGLIISSKNLGQFEEALKYCDEYAVKISRAEAEKLRRVVAEARDSGRIVRKESALDMALKIVNHARETGLLPQNDHLQHIPELLTEAKPVCRKVFQELIKDEDGRRIWTWMCWGAYDGMGAVLHWHLDWDTLRTKGIAETLLEPRGVDEMDEDVIDSIGIGFETPEGQKLCKDVYDLSMWACIQFVPNSSEDDAVQMMHETMQSMYIFGMVYEMERLGMR